MVDADQTRDCGQGQRVVADSRPRTVQESQAEVGFDAVRQPQPQDSDIKLESGIKGGYHENEVAQSLISGYKPRYRTTWRKRPTLGQLCGQFMAEAERVKE